MIGAEHHSMAMRQLLPDQRSRLSSVSRLAEGLVWCVVANASHESLWVGYLAVEIGTREVEPWVFGLEALEHERFLDLRLCQRVVLRVTLEQTIPRHALGALHQRQVQHTVLCSRCAQQRGRAISVGLAVAVSNHRIAWAARPTVAKAVART